MNIHLHTHVQIHTQIYTHTHQGSDICRKSHADINIYKDMACTYTHVQKNTKHKQREALPSLFHLIFVAFKITVNYYCVGCSDGVIACERFF